MRRIILSMVLLCGILLNADTIPEFSGVYIQTKDNNFIELKNHKKTGNWAIGRQSMLGGRNVNSAIAKSEDGFVINQISIKDYKYFITRGSNRVMLDIGEKQGFNNGYYWITPTGNLEGKGAKNGDVIKMKADINLNDIYYMRVSGYGHILIKFH